MLCASVAFLEPSGLPSSLPACPPARLQALKRKLAARKSFVPWGGGKFVLPHMITVDWDGNVWVTGVCVEEPSMKQRPRELELPA